MTHDEFEQAMKANRAALAEQTALLREQVKISREMAALLKDQAKHVELMERRAR